MESIREEVARALDDFMESDREAKASLRAQQKTLDDQEARLVDLAAEGQLPIAKIRQRLDLITLQKAAIAEKLTRTEMRMQVGSEQVLAFVELLEDPGKLYESVAEGTRRDLLLAFFRGLRVYEDDEGIRIERERTELNEALHAWQAQRRVAQADHITNEKKRASRISAEGFLTSTSTGLNESNGLSNSIMVGMTGFEPATP